MCANYECLGYNWYQPFCCFTVLNKVCFGSFICVVSRNTSGEEENNHNRYTKELFEMAFAPVFYNYQVNQQSARATDNPVTKLTFSGLN